MNATNSNEIGLAVILSCELCSFLPSLFEDQTMFQKADKPPLAEVITKFVMGKGKYLYRGKKYLEILKAKKTMIFPSYCFHLQTIAVSQYQYAPAGGSFSHGVLWWCSMATKVVLLRQIICIEDGEGNAVRLIKDFSYN